MVLTSAIRAVYTTYSGAGAEGPILTPVRKSAGTIELFDPLPVSTPKIYMWQRKYAGRPFFFKSRDEKWLVFL